MKLSFFFVQNLKETVHPKPEELGPEILRECSPSTMCHMSGVTCHV